jgi:hypothetical protein
MVAEHHQDAASADKDSGLGNTTGVFQCVHEGSFHRVAPSSEGIRSGEAGNQVHPTLVKTGSLCERCAPAEAADSATDTTGVTIDNSKCVPRVRTRQHGWTATESGLRVASSIVRSGHRKCWQVPRLNGDARAYADHPLMLEPSWGKAIKTQTGRFYAGSRHQQADGRDSAAAS